MLTSAAQCAVPEASLELEPDGLLASSVDAARRAVAAMFRSRGLDTPDLDARLIIGHALGLDHTALATQAKRKLLRGEAARISALASRRLLREPIARILGAKEFWGLLFRIEAHSFVPRPETETVVEAALQAVSERSHCSRGLRIADLGTGPGTLVLSLLSALRGASGVGTDISAAAIDCARYNAAAQGACATFVVCHYGAALQGAFDLLVSNPPYIPRGEIATLEPEVRAFDPLIALDGGTDGLDGYRAIATEAGRLLAPEGILVVEIGAGKATAVRSLFSAAGLASTPPRPDLCGTPRALVAWRLA
ncbi:MAG TPA: peptide chain release factor N(5)-glutamine methyltransferase [Xanthobacteraceae bacterium]|jgi:release factor glutamine methyltransferase